MGNVMDDWFGMDPPKKPKVPTADEIAQEQQKYEIEAQRANIAANRVDQNTPFASIKWAPTGTDQWGNTTYGATTTLSEENQSLLDQLFQNRGISGDVAGNLLQSLQGSSAYGSEGLPDLTSAIQPMMDRQLEYLNPYFEQQQENRLNELRNRGLEPGNPAYDYEMMKLMQQQDSSVGNYLNTFTNTAMDLWKMPIGGIQQLMGMSGPVFGSAENFGFSTVPTSNQNAVNYLQASKQSQDALNEQYKQALEQYNSQVSAVGQGLGMVMGLPFGGIGTVGSALGGAVGGGLGNMLGLTPTAPPPK